MERGAINFVLVICGVSCALHEHGTRHISTRRGLNSCHRQRLWQPCSVKATHLHQLLNSDCTQRLIVAAVIICLLLRGRAISALTARNKSLNHRNTIVQIQESPCRSTDPSYSKT